MEKNGLGARNPSVRLVWHESKFCGNKRPKSEVICAGVGRVLEYVRNFSTDTQVFNVRVLTTPVC